MTTEAQPFAHARLQNHTRKALFEWTDAYSVNIHLLDSQHKRLFELVNSLHSAMLTQQTNQVMAGILNELVSYTRMHFWAEEELLKKYGYPDFLQHKTEHDQLTKQVLEFQQRFLTGQERISIQLMEFLKNWLADHINNTDQRYSEFLTARGAR